MFGQREFEEDPFFSMHSMHREHMRRMEQMMGDPLHPLFHEHHNPMLSLIHHDSDRQVALGGRVGRQRRDDIFSPFGMFGRGFGSMFTDMDQVVGNMQRQRESGNSHSFSQASFVSYSKNDEDQPRVYQAMSSMRQVPGGVKETRKAVRDSKTGVDKMAVGHHINDRAHIIQRSRNRKTGSEDENQDFVNIGEDEVEAFDQEFRQKAKGYGHHDIDQNRQHRHRSRRAVTDGRRHRRENLIQFNELGKNPGA